MKSAKFHSQIFPPFHSPEASPEFPRTNHEPRLTTRTSYNSALLNLNDASDTVAVVQVFHNLYTRKYPEDTGTSNPEEKPWFAQDIMAKPKLTLYVDIVSPFGYIAYYMCRHSPIFRSVEITYIPIFLGGLMKACNNRPPLDIRNKDKWVNTERLRYSRLFAIPMIPNTPPGFPLLTLQTQRALCALQLSHPAQLATAIDALYHSLWVDSNGLIGKAEGFGPVLSQCLGEEIAKDVLARMGSPEAKNRLSENTNQAFESGGFGLPWFECTNAEGEKDAFWGVDHLGMVVRFLGLDGNLELERSDGMRAML